MNIHTDTDNYMAIFNQLIVLSPLLFLTVDIPNTQSQNYSLQSFNKSVTTALVKTNPEIDKKPKRSSSCRGDGRRDANGGKCGTTR